MIANNILTAASWTAFDKRMQFYYDYLLVCGVSKNRAKKLVEEEFGECADWCETRSNTVNQFYTLVIHNVGKEPTEITVYDPETKTKRKVVFTTFMDAQEAANVISSMRIDTAFIDCYPSTIPLAKKAHP